MGPAVVAQGGRTSCKGEDRRETQALQLSETYCSRDDRGSDRLPERRKEGRTKTASGEGTTHRQDARSRGVQIRHDNSAGTTGAENPRRARTRDAAAYSPYGGIDQDGCHC